LSGASLRVSADATIAAARSQIVKRGAEDVEQRALHDHSRPSFSWRMLKHGV
jgi:hypothetical protein